MSLVIYFLLLHYSLNPTAAAVHGAEQRTHTHTHIPQVEFSVQEASTSSFVIHTHPPPPPRPIGEQDPGRAAQTLTCDLGEERWMDVWTQRWRPKRQKNAQHTVNWRVSACGIFPDSTRRCEAEVLTNAAAGFPKKNNLAVPLQLV